MREILFRGKRVDNGEWICGDLQQNRGTAKIREREVDIDRISKSFAVDPDSIGAYTNLIDGRGKRIFEGDILKADTGIKHYATVIFRLGGFWIESDIENPRYLGDIPREFLLVVGDIYDNHELLGGDKK